MHFRKILIVDDDEAIREICSEALIMTGYSVERASNGLEAFESLQSFNFDAVVSDIDMPLLDGISFYINAINDFPYLRDRFLFISGAISREKIALLTDFKRSYLRKPFKISELIEHIEKVISHPLSKPGIDTLEKRRWTRYKWMAFCKIAEPGGPIEKEIAAKIRGVSRYGIEIVHEGAALEKSAGVVITIDLAHCIFRKKATVAWSRSLSGYEAVAGLEFTEPIPLSQVVTLS